MSISNSYRVGDVGFKVGDNAFAGVTEDTRYRNAIRALARNSDEAELLLRALKNASSAKERTMIIRAYVNQLDVLDQGRYIRALANRIDDEAKSIIAITPEHLNDIIHTSKRVSSELNIIAKSIEREQTS